MFFSQNFSTTIFCFCSTFVHFFCSLCCQLIFNFLFWFIRFCSLTACTSTCLNQSYAEHFVLTWNRGQNMFSSIFFLNYFLKITIFSRFFYNCRAVVCSFLQCLKGTLLLPIGSRRVILSLLNFIPFFNTCLLYWSIG